MKKTNNYEYVFKYTDLEHKELVRKFKQEGCEKSFAMLYDDFKDFIHSRKDKYTYKLLTPEDLDMLAIETFMRSIKEYNPDHPKAFPFVKWVMLETKRVIQKNLAKAHRDPDVPLYVYELLNKINIVWDQLIYEAKEGVEVGLKDVAENLNIDYSIIKNLLRTCDVSSAGATTVNIDSIPNFEERNAGQNEHTFYAASNKQEQAELIATTGATISRSQQCVIAMSFGLNEMSLSIFNEVINQYPVLREKVLDIQANQEDANFEQFYKRAVKGKLPMPDSVKAAIADF